MLLTPEQAEKKGKCYYWRKEDGSIVALQFHSTETNKTYALVPTSDWPSFTVSGIRMHPKSPRASTGERMRLLAPRRGNALDVCTGLGYSAIALAEKATLVTTIESDENILELAKWNPYSHALFENPRIELIVGDAAEKIRELPSNFFEWVCTDPPRFPLGAELYSLEFYKQLYRVTARGGKLFHYTGNPFSKNRKMSFLKGVAQRLREAGFQQIKWHEEALGFTAVKG
ncbi:hypothetical protein COX86_01375 [Candidatus Micrarchaeota archaeon CG_4_10_14_0_2_um_filter_60_11]|nr:MAG: hypothetical protein AUJ16_01365 [Candidatus Micrarchaeota archaeon CG1_02_60_51]PIN96346.1 MAG: hypothetical protein COU39_01610 [Candidatus Micrarchaeota archaeon CG10_big_fil_rev_8_21_14_0_10_60_32]PIO01733.1 MAG: hypothetical protein COT58_03625 [Candidatus Micrarchaeota archaeon CG09_land_8_20_14_0_10_60_16]PIY91871.1 MAG: hypothetical protein COY71_00865 [Candidatus Micrarchaeota archaeon CG_4_10_14_0_8_um_filter_60_7]PIZ91113.1 MAG: hypothetical protein COX86_01375 [Candidatus Mi